MDKFTWVLTTSLFLADLAIRIIFSLRIIMRKRAPSVSFAWLVIILLFPFIGAITYLLFGENRIGERRAQRLLKNRSVIKEWTLSLQSTPPQIDWQHKNPECIPLERQSKNTTGIPTMPGNHLELLDNAVHIFTRLIADINAAQSSCYLEFYILSAGGQMAPLLEALLAASQRGVICRLLLDNIGSKQFLRSKEATRLQKAGIQIVAALPAGLIRALFVRLDLRNHRKLALIDGKIAYTGSQNLVDPLLFKQEEGVGHWVDAMVRITGPVVEFLTALFMYDWLLESDQRLCEYAGKTDIQQVPPQGEALVQLAPSGPGFRENTIHNLLLTTIYAARTELILTTPYFVPDNAILAALETAAQRGVEVILIIPAHNDSRLVHYASRARYESLTQAGVHIKCFTGGLLHTKTITIDGDFCLFGSVNLDMRSFWINFELSLFIYDQNFTKQIKKLQLSYLKEAVAHDPAAFQNRSYGQRFLENAALLVGPLL